MSSSACLLCPYIRALGIIENVAMRMPHFVLKILSTFSNTNVRGEYLRTLVFEPLQPDVILDGKSDLNIIGIITAYSKFISMIGNGIMRWQQTLSLHATQVWLQTLAPQQKTPIHKHDCEELNIVTKASE